jgi:hypothetical protein
MMRRNLRSMSATDLVNAFAHFCIEQYDAMEGNENARANRLVWKVHELEMELKSRSGDQRHLLKALYSHSNMQVRLAAARATLAIDYSAARGELQAIVAEQWYPQTAEARMCLENLDTGFYRPT